MNELELALDKCDTSALALSNESDIMVDECNTALHIQNIIY